MVNRITIKNRLRVLRGNKIIVPGCEPISAFTSPTLAANWTCTASVVDLADALAAIPGSSVLELSNPRELYFVLPSGPPQSPELCNDPCTSTVEDWYQALRDIATEEVEQEDAREPTLEDLCRTLPLKGIF